MIDSAVTDLPEPDSPTTATVSPRLIENDRLRTAVTTRSDVANWTVRSATSTTLPVGGGGKAMRAAWRRGTPIIGEPRRRGNAGWNASRRRRPAATPTR